MQSVPVPSPNCAKLNMQIINQLSLLDRSWPGLTMMVTGTAGHDWQGTGGNYATVGQKRRRRGGRCVQRQREKRKGKSVEVRIRTLNVGTMAGKGRELEIEGGMINVISAYAPQVGCEMEEKGDFSSKLDEVVLRVPKEERVLIGADFNGHVGEGNRGDGWVWCQEKECGRADGGRFCKNNDKCIF